MFRWDDSVKFDKLHPAMVLATLRVNAIYEEMGLKDLWITSGNDRTHKTGSKHYDGKALDYRTKLIPTVDQKNTMFAQVKAALGPQFFVDLEDLGKDNEHLHVQFNGT